MGLVYDHSANFGHTRKRKAKVKPKTALQTLRAVIAKEDSRCVECGMYDGAHWHWCKTGKVPE